jgi:leucyl aminopeptidase
VKKRDVAWRVRQAAMIVQDALVPLRPAEVEERSEVRRPLRKLTFCVSRRNELGRLRRVALAEGLAMAAGVELAKDLGNLPGNICTPGVPGGPGGWATGQAAHGLAVDVLDSARHGKAGHEHPAVGGAGATHEPPKFIVLRHAGGTGRGEAGGAGRQGHHLRLGRYIPEAGPGNGRDEVRHVRRGQRARRRSKSAASDEACR